VLGQVPGDLLADPQLGDVLGRADDRDDVPGIVEQRSSRGRDPDRLAIAADDDAVPPDPCTTPADSGTDTQSCSAPGVWTIDPDGKNEDAVITRAPDSITLAGYYGFQPLAWLDDEHVLVGLRTDSGTEGAILDTKTRHLRRLGDYADLASSDGRFSVGSGGTQSLILSVLRLSDGHRVLLRKQACCPSWNR